MTILTLTAEQSGERADQFLSRSVETLTRSAAQKLLEQGKVTTPAGKALKKNARLEPGDVLLVEVPEPEPLDVEPENIPLDIVYEDEDVVVVNKAVGMVVHPAPGHNKGTLVNALLYHCGKSLSGINGVLRPGIVHRIDRDTSGLLIVAKNDAAHLSLARQLEEHSLRRTYQAVVVGGFREEAGTVDAPIARHPKERKRMAVVSGGKRAVTHWRVVERFNGCTWVECQLETGRTHQIRVHMAHIHHPLLGDTVYGAKKPYPGLAGQCLHAGRLRFTHPSTGEVMEVEAPLPDYFKAVVEKLRKL